MQKKLQDRPGDWEARRESEEMLNSSQTKLINFQFKSKQESLGKQEKSTAEKKFNRGPHVMSSCLEGSDLFS